MDSSARNAANRILFAAVRIHHPSKSLNKKVIFIAKYYDHEAAAAAATTTTTRRSQRRRMKSLRHHQEKVVVRLLLLEIRWSLIHLTRSYSKDDGAKSYRMPKRHSQRLQTALPPLCLEFGSFDSAAGGLTQQ